MKRIALVVQRYGEEINGGAEALVRMLAERLKARFDVEVLTSCALDYSTWAMHYPPGGSDVCGVRVLRFAHPLRNDVGRARVPLVHKLRFKLRALLRRLPGAQVAAPRGDSFYDGRDFLRRQGPHCEGLLQHLRGSAKRYDAVIFFTALYEPATLGVEAFGRRSVLVPLLHDEKPMYQPVYGEVMRKAGALVFNTDAERRLAAKMYGIDTRNAPVAGAGVEIVTPTAQAVAQVLARRGLGPGYLVYVGRIDVSKGCKQLLNAFLAHLRKNPAAQLVLVGKAVMPVPEHPRILSTGFVSDAERDALIKGAAALVIPSRYESLSLVLLEAMLLRTPVIANAQCDVLADHIAHSGAGLAYRGQAGLVRAMAVVQTLDAAGRERWATLGAAYVQRSCSWPNVLQQYADAVEAVSVLPDFPAPAHQPC